MRWVAFQCEFAQLNAVKFSWHADKWKGRGTAFAVALMFQHRAINGGRGTMLLLAERRAADGW